MIIKKEIEVCATVDQVLIAITDIVRGLIVEKKDPATVITGEMNHLINIASNFKEFGPEVQDSHIISTCLNGAGDIANVFIQMKNLPKA